MSAAESVVAGQLAVLSVGVFFARAEGSFARAGGLLK